MRAGIKVNTTLVFSTTQALWAANAGAVYISPFLSPPAGHGYPQEEFERGPDDSPCWVDAPDREYEGPGGPLMDAGARLILEIATVFADYEIETEILVASSGNPVQLTECLLAGADVLTVPAAELATAVGHALGETSMTMLAEDAVAFGK